MDKDIMALCAEYGVERKATASHMRNQVSVIKEQGSARVYRVKLASRETAVTVERRLRNAMDGQGCIYRASKLEKDGSYVVVAEVRKTGEATNA